MDVTRASRLAGRFDPAAAGELASRCDAVLAPGRHGDLPRWLETLSRLPATDPDWWVADGAVAAGSPVEDRQELIRLLKEFIPWRKGPLTLGGVKVDTEWRSDWKWDRIAPHIDLAGQTVLDVGAGNGYYGWRMLDAGASLVVGCDPTLVYFMQHLAISHFAGPGPNLVFPLRLEELPARLTGFETVFSMGVLYHRAEPVAHLRELKARLAPGGHLILESLILPDDGDCVLVPEARYANMRNVHALPTVGRLLRWLADAGFRDPVVVDRTATTPGEQRSTEWMPFHSLEDALSPDRSATVEGHPPPLRAMLRALA